ncbi:hypothetical protein Ga0102493_112663 [Erythrobacter litoralis]|uniref:Uncharacterized protein n=1 Tax=Erythrobacter litoralis TaxID=39960 RepID=A0A074NM22_9SPHN|nr:hypothetical protein [Erythrobacter litoralis]AOL23674.1 hypothetical protein Ga0102493_112663 [Erythrobacter litoralis]KEO98842.1 hypothetical protein EH32_06980 [Erythrobacter litoralis]
MGGKVIAQQANDNTGLYLLFAPGKRPDRDSIRRFAERHPAVSLSHDPFDPPTPGLIAASADGDAPAAPAGADLAEKVWVELLRDGLTFDLRGLVPGRACPVPHVENLFDMEDAPNLSTCEGMRIMPGPHLAGGERTVPVMRGMIALARDLVHHFDDLAAVAWPPAKSAIGRRFFESTVTAWLEGGAFPALGLTAFREDIDGALQSVGLEHWIGQELRIEPPLSADRASATRLGVRLVNQLVLVGGLDESERIIAPDGTRLILRPSRNGRFIRVWRE